MKTSLYILLSPLLLSLSSACSTVPNVQITFYGWPDNSPPGAGTAYNCAGRNYIAQGTFSTFIVTGACIIIHAPSSYALRLSYLSVHNGHVASM